ncbi:MAG: leucine-rich repeat protein [Lachnospiraceae bacterium]|nr:leucine-rich repeat protein [Lachnospiraceae bacterium]
MKGTLKKGLFFVFIIIAMLGIKSYVNAEVVRNLTGESTASGWVYGYKYWDGRTWHHSASEKYTNYPIDITYDATYCYEEAYKMIELVNTERRKAGVPELQAKDELMDVAMMRAAETAVYWSHTRPDGSSWCSASIYSAGENLHAGSRLAADANKSLVNSSGHYAQMIDAKFLYAGFGCVKVDDTYYWVQIFSYPNIYYEDGYFGKDSENNRPVLWDKMALGNRKDYTAPFTAKVNPKLITLKSTHENEWSGEGLYVGEETQGKVYTYYYDKLKDWTCEVNLLSDQYDVKVLTPDLCSCQDGKIRALKAGTAKIQYTLKADSSLSTILEIQIKDVPIKKGSRVAAGENEYKITSTGSRTVSFYRAKKDAASVTVPDTVKIQGKTYKVTSVAENAFKGSKKLKSVTVGRNVTSIGKNAFNGCSGLKKVTVKTVKLKSVRKNALKGIHKKAVIKVPKSRLSKYKKLFKGKGQSKTVKIKK